MQDQIHALSQENKGLKDEIGELTCGSKGKKKVLKLESKQSKSVTKK